MRKSQTDLRSLNPQEASTLAQIAQIVSATGGLAKEYTYLLENLGQDAKQIVTALLLLAKSRAASSSKTKAKNIYRDAAEDLLNWVETNKSYLQAK